MNTKNDGGPAFPCEYEGSTRSDAYGMSLRDYFAAKAMQGLISGKEEHQAARINARAQAAYAYADAMLAARELQQ